MYEHLKDNYSPIGRKSKDPVMMFKILILSAKLEVAGNGGD